MNSKLSSLYMQWQYWSTEALYYANICKDNEGLQSLFRDAQARAEYIQREFDKEAEKKNE